MSEETTVTLEVYFPPLNVRRHGPLACLGVLQMQHDDIRTIAVAFAEAWANVIELYGDEPHAERTSLVLRDRKNSLEYVAKDWKGGPEPMAGDISYRHLT